MDDLHKRVESRIFSLENHIECVEDAECKSVWTQEVLDQRELLRRSGQYNALRARVAELESRLAEIEAQRVPDARVEELKRRAQAVVNSSHPTLLVRADVVLAALATSPHATAQGSSESCPHCLPIVGHELAKRCSAAGQPAAVPDALDENERPDVWNMAYAAGWNDCRKAALATQRQGIEDNTNG